MMYHENPCCRSPESPRCCSFQSRTWTSSCRYHLNPRCYEWRSCQSRYRVSLSQNRFRLRRSRHSWTRSRSQSRSLLPENRTQSHCPESRSRHLGSRSLLRCCFQLELVRVCVCLRPGRARLSWMSLNLKSLKKIQMRNH